MALPISPGENHENASKSRSLSIFRDNTQKRLAQVETLLKQYDVNGDGQLGPEEILDMHDHLRKSKLMKNNMIKASIVLVVLMCFSVVANFGIEIWADIISKDVTIKGRDLTTVNNLHVVATSAAQANIPLALLPLAGINVVDKVTHVQFTALNISVADINSASWSPLFTTFPRLLIGMDVASYEYYNETTVVLRGFNNETVLIRHGSVYVSGLVNMSPSAVVPVCPGLQDSSYAVCSLTSTNDVDTQSLVNRGTFLGFRKTYSTCR